MGTITSGVGLVTGIDYQAMVEQLIALDARPRDQLLKRVANLGAQQTAFLDISARVTALLNRVDTLGRAATFRTNKTTSSAPALLTAISSATTGPGSYQFIPRALATTHQFVSRGYNSRTAPLPSGTFTIESAQARVNSHTRLDELNGHTGVRRGSFELLNGLGAKAQINLSEAVTLGDVLSQISAAGLNVTAEVLDDRLVLTDQSGGSGPLRVVELAGGRTAADLGFSPGTNTSSSGRLEGSGVFYLAATSPLSALNDGLGIASGSIGNDFRILSGGQTLNVELSATLSNSTRLGRLNHGQGVRDGTIRITARDGTTAEVNLTGKRTIHEVRTAIQGAFGDERISVTVTGSRLVVTDDSDISNLPAGQVTPLKIEDVTGFAARDLGIAGTATNNRISGSDVLHMTTLGDVLTAINFATGNEDAQGQRIVTAGLRPDGRGLQMVSADNKLSIEVTDGSAAARALRDLGFESGDHDGTVTGKRLLGGLNTVLLQTLQGGRGLGTGTMTITANGRTATLDFSGAETLADVVRTLNGATDADGQLLGIEADYSGTGTRLVLRNTTNGSPLTVTGAFAEALGLAQSGYQITGDNLQRKYLSENTSLSSLNGGRGVNLSRIKLTGSDGVPATVDLRNGSIRTLGDLIDQIESVHNGLRARINDTGDGLLIESRNGGLLRIEDDDGTAARDLNIRGTSNEGHINGAFEFRFTVGGGDTLESIAARIGTETTLARASVLNDGTGFAPYRLSLTAAVSGLVGSLLIDDPDDVLGVTMLTQAQDARVFFGGNTGTGVLLTSSTNTFNDVVDGLSLTIHSVENTPVTVQIDRDQSGLVKAAQDLVSDYNTLMQRVRDAGKFDEKNQALGILQGNSTLRIIESRLYSAFTSLKFTGASFERLRDLGIEADTGNKLKFNEEKFRSALEQDPDAVERFFTDADKGVSKILNERLKQINDDSGLIGRETGTMKSRTELLNERVTVLNERLERKRTRLLRQFQAMESALSSMQSQQTALANLSQLQFNTMSSQRR